MSEEEKTETTESTDGGINPDGVTQEPPGNPDVDQEAVDKGLDQLERVKPY